MPHVNLWAILAIIAIVSLVFFGRRKSYIWFGLFLGVVAGVVVATVYLCKGFPFSWSIIKKDAIIGTIVGSLLDLLIYLLEKGKKEN